MRAVLYVRVSRGEIQNPQSQLTTLRAWARSRNWVVVDEQIDRVTGDPARRSRTPPGLAAALDLIKRRRAKVLAIFAADRLVRSPRELLDLVDLVQKMGGSIASYQDGSDLDTTTDNGELLVFLKGWYARLELRLISSRTKAGMARARAQGKVIGRPFAGPADLQKVAALERQQCSQKQMAKELNTTVHRIRLAQEELRQRRAAKLLGAANKSKERS